MDPQQTKVFTAVLIASVVLGSIILYFVVSLIRHQRRYADLNRKNVLAELAVLDKDRLRIAADLHDDLAPMLSAARFQVNSIEADQDSMESVEKAKEHIDYLSGRLREIATDLVPASLVSKGLVVSLERFFSAVPSSEISVSFQHNLKSRLPDQKSINCYRIVQEIFQNALKHSGAKRFAVQITEKDKKVTIICEDDGRGFQYEKKIADSDGMGLRNIRNRAEIMSSRFMVKSVPGRGTQYLVEIPID